MNRLFSEKNATLQSAEICSRPEDFSPWLGWACVCCVHLYWSWLTNVPSSRGPGSAVITRPQLRRIIHTHHLSTVHSQHYTNYHWPALEVSLLLRIAMAGSGEAKFSSHDYCGRKRRTSFVNICLNTPLFFLLASRSCCSNSNIHSFTRKFVLLHRKGWLVAVVIWKTLASHI